MNVRRRKPAAGSDSASTTRSENWSRTYMAPVTTRYGSAEVARSSRPRRAEGVAYGARSSRQNEGRSASVVISPAVIAATVQDWACRGLRGRRGRLAPDESRRGRDEPPSRPRTRTLPERHRDRTGPRGRLRPPRARHLHAWP